MIGPALITCGAPARRARLGGRSGQLSRCAHDGLRVQQCPERDRAPACPRLGPSLPACGLPARSCAGRGRTPRACFPRRSPRTRGAEGAGSACGIGAARACVRAPDARASRRSTGGKGSAAAREPACAARTVSGRCALLSGSATRPASSHRARSCSTRPERGSCATGRLPHSRTVLVIASLLAAGAEGHAPDSSDPSRGQRASSHDLLPGGNHAR